MGLKRPPVVPAQAGTHPGGEPGGGSYPLSLDGREPAPYSIRGLE